MKTPLRVIMLSEVISEDPADMAYDDYVTAVVDANGETIVSEGDFFRISRADADLIVAAVNAYQSETVDKLQAAHEAGLREAIKIANGVKKNSDLTYKRTRDSHSQGMSYAADAIARRIHEGLTK